MPRTRRTYQDSSRNALPIVLRVMRFLTIMLAGVAFLCGTAHANTAAVRTVDQPWGKVCTLTWCQQQVVADDDGLSKILRIHAQTARAVADAEKGRGCVTPRTWPRHTIPAAMILDRGGRVRVAAWTYPAPAGETTMRLCAR